MQLVVVLLSVGEESVVMPCQPVWCLRRDSLAAAEPVAIESVVIPPGNRSKLSNLDAVKPVSSLGCACRMHTMHRGGAMEVVKL